MNEKKIIITYDNLPSLWVLILGVHYKAPPVSI